MSAKQEDYKLKFGTAGKPVDPQMKLNPTKWYHHTIWSDGKKWILYIDGLEVKPKTMFDYSVKFWLCSTVKQESLLVRVKRAWQILRKKG